ncbi:MAG: hypothetical protein KTR19_02640, partial [Hyphomicrobiales bacterium]|nr:hypothetical protein [Hyphomicrobiales bacterium]
MVLRWELIASVVLHGAVLVMAFGAFWTVPASPPSKPVAVSIVKLSESSQLKSGRKFAESEEGVAGSETAPNRAAKAEAVIPSLEPVDTAPREQKTTESIKQAALPPPKQAGLNAQEPPPQDISEETAHGVPIPVRAQRPQPRYQERWQKPSVDVAQTRSDQIAGLIRKPSKQVARREDAGRFDPERIAALLNRTPNTRPEPRESEEQNTNTPWRYPHSLEEQMARALQNDDLKQRIAYGASDGRDNRMSANDIDAFRAQ